VTWWRGLPVFGGPLDEPIVFVGDVREFADASGARISGRGVWPALAETRGDEPRFISYGSWMLRHRSDLLHVRLAGLQYRDAAARTTADGAPGERLQLLPEPSNPANADALAVFTADRRHQLGYVYDDDLRDVRAALDRGWVALNAWEWRHENGERYGVHLLLAAPQDVARLEEIVRRPPAA